MHHMSVHDHRWYSHTSTFLVLLVLTLGPICLAREKKDVIQLVNSDRMTGEIVTLEKGNLYVKLAIGEGTVSHPRSHSEVVVQNRAKGGSAIVTLLLSDSHRSEAQRAFVDLRA